jgi:LuxR family maltose regulon positive regulatory protein
MRVLVTRLYPPRRDSELIARPASHKALGLAESSRLVLIKAPAGYGKSTLMVDCYWRLAQRPRLAVWLSLNEFDGSASELALYLAHALTEAGLTVPELPEASSREGVDATIKRICALLNDVFNALGEPLYVFLDDLHAVHGQPAEALLAALWKESTDQVHWIAGSRCLPRAPLARMRALGQLGELGVEDLRFTPQESRELLALLGGGPVSEPLAALGHQSTEGWAAGLQLVSIALRRSDATAQVVSQLSGKQRDIAAFFRDEVFGRLDESMQSFLLQTCLLSRFTPALCDAMTGRSDGREMLDRLEAASLFVFALDEEQRWYRYHHLFADFVRNILHQRHPAMASALHLRASHWLSTQGLIGEALAHATRCDDQFHAAQLLDHWWDTLNSQGGFVSTGRIAASLPQHVLDRFPRVQLWRALYMIVESRFDEARRLLAGVKRQLDALAADPSADAAQLAEWQALYQHRCMELAQFSDDVPELERLCAELLAPDRLQHPHLLGTAQMGLLIAWRERYRLRECEALNVRSRELLSAPDNPPMRVWHACSVGPWLMQRGQYEAAIEQYRGAVEAACGCASKEAESGLLAMPLVLLADALLERHAVDEARSLFDRAASYADGVGMVDYLQARYVGRARLAFLDGDTALADKVLAEGFEIALARPFDRLRWQVTHERIRQALARGDVWTAQHLGSDAGLAAHETELRPAQNVSSLHETRALAWARLAVATGRHAEALRLMRAWLSFAEPRGALASLVRLSLVAARAQHAGGDGRGALRSVAQALGYAAAGGMVLSFVQEGEPVRSLVLKVLEDEEFDPALRAFKARLARAMGVPYGEPASAAPAASGAHTRGACDAVDEASAPVEALTPREIDILRHVSRSMLYKEIADRLGLTEGSVKWYMQQIYSKLGVRRRLRAVEKARALGYV